MTDIANLELRVDATSVDKGTSALKAFREENVRSTSALADMAAQINRTEAAYRAEAAEANKATAAARENLSATGAVATAHRAKAEALGASTAAYVTSTVATERQRLAQLALTEAMQKGTSITSQMIKDAGGLTNAMKIMEQAHLGAASGLKSVASETEKVFKGFGGAAISTSLFTRELLVMGREIGRGDMSRLAGSATIMAQAVGLLPIIFSATGLAITGTVGAIGAFIAIESAGEAESAKFQNSLTATGNYAGFTADKFEDMAGRIAKSQDVGIRSVKAGIQELVSSGKFTADTIELMVSNAETYSKLTGVSVDKILKGYEDMKGGVVKWGVKEEEVHHDLTLIQLDRINQLEKLGQHAEAEHQIQLDIANNIKDRMVPQYGLLQRTFHDVGTAASNMWDQILGVGRTKTLEEKITGVQEKLQAMPAGMSAESLAKSNNYKGLQLQLGALQLLKSGDDRKAAEDAAAARAEDDAIRAKYDNQFLKPKKLGPTYRDDYDQRHAQIDAAIESARAQELTAQLSITHELFVRSAIENDIRDAAAAAKSAQIDREIAQVAADRGISDAQKEHLTNELNTVKESYNRAAELQKQADGEKLIAGLVREDVELQTSRRQDTIDLLGSRRDLANSSFEQSKIDLEILDQEREIKRIHLQEIIYSGQTTQNQKDIASGQLEVLDTIYDNKKLLTEQNNTIIEATNKALKSIGDIVNGFKRGDFQSAFSSMIDGFKEFAGILGNVSSVMVAKASGLLSSVGTGFGIANSLGIRGTGSSVGNLAVGAAGYGAGMLASSMFGGAIANTVVGGAMSMGASVGLSSSLGTLLSSSAVLGPLGIIAGLAAAGLIAALSSGGKSNEGASYNLVSGALGGNKSTTQTQGYVKTAGDAILSGEQALRDAGIQLTTTVNDLVIGTRDLSTITLSNGQSVHSAIGDAADAANTGLRAILQDAIYVSDTQKSLVLSMVDAGKGFDEITDALSGYAAVQSAVQSIGDSILKITDPRAYELTTLKRGQDARDQGITDAHNLGYLSDDQFVEITTQLTRLKELEVGKVLEKYADAIEAIDNTGTELKQSIGDRLLELTDPKAYDLTTLNRAQNARQASLQSAADKGLITAAEFDTLNDTLQRINGIEIDKILEKYADAIVPVVEVVKTSVQDLKDAYSRQTSAINQNISTLTTLRSGLTNFMRGLTTGPAAMLSPQDQYNATKAQFFATSALARGGDKEAISNLSSVGDAFLQASKDYNASSGAYFSDLNAVKGVVTEIGGSLDKQITVAQAQLNALDSVVNAFATANNLLFTVSGGVITLNESLLTVGQAIQNLQSQSGLVPGAPAANDNGTGPDGSLTAVDYWKYGADNPDLASNYFGGGILSRQYSSYADALKGHYEGTGQYEIADGTRQFARGGAFPKPGVIRGPADFSLGRAGESGPEGALPLVDVGGKLGVHATIDPAMRVLMEKMVEMLSQGAEQQALATQLLQQLNEKASAQTRAIRNAA